MSNRQPFLRRFLSRLLASAVLAAAVGLLAAVPSVAQVTVTRTSGDVFYIDTSDDLFGMYAAYRIYNGTGAALDEVWVTASGFTGGVVSLAPNEDGIVKVGDLAAGASKTVFFYYQATAATVTAQSHTIRVYNDRPSYGGSIIATQAFSFTAVEETIAALANKVTTVVTGPNPPGLGGIVTITVTGQTGTIGNSKIVSYSPATWTDWPANAYQLTGTQIVMTGGNTATYTDQLYAVVANKAATDYTATYTFVAVGTTAAPTHVSPVGYIASGTQIKHTDTGNFGPTGTLQPVQPADNQVRLTSKTVDAGGITAAGGTAIYTLTFQNTGSVATTVNEVIDVLPTTPASVTYVPGSSTVAGAAAPDPVISGSTLTWPDGISVPVGGSRTVTYQVTFPAMPGTYANSAYGLIGSEQIDTTLDTSNDAPATVDVVVPAEADLSVAISVDNPSPSPGQAVTFTVTVSNGGPSPGVGIEVAAFSDTLPAGVSFGSATASQGTYDRRFWTVGTLASGASATLQLTFTIHSDGQYRLLAEVSRATYPDPDSTPYDGLGDDFDDYDLTTSGGSGGGIAGLESNGTLATTLAQVLFDRRVRASETGALRVARFQFDPAATAGKAMASGDVLRSLIPATGPERSEAFETSPTDLLPVTNADDVVAVDYLRERDGRRIGALFGTLTGDGAVYEHTKVICDRLKGARLTSVRLVEIAGRPFILSRLLHESGEIDYAVTLTAYRTASGFTVDSRFRLDEYAAPQDASDVLNLQVWSVSPAHTAELVASMLERLDTLGTVEFAMSPAAPPIVPDVYVRTGRYANGKLEIELYNGAGVDHVRLTGGSIALTERGDRLSFERTVPLPPAGPDHVVTVQVDLGPVFDATFFVESPDGGRDQMYLADGAWGFTFDGTGARVEDLSVAPALATAGKAEAGMWSIERSANIKGEVKSWAALFRYLRANGRPLDLSPYGYVEFTAAGEGQVRVLFEKESVRTSDHFGTVIRLSSEPKTYRIWFDELRRPDGTGRLSAEDLVLISFYVIGDQGRMRPFELEVSDFRFGGGEGDPLATVPDRWELAQNYPNPFNPRTEIGFGLPESGRVRLVVYDMLGRRVADLVDGWMDAGRHRVGFDASALSSGVYVYRLETAARTVSRTMTLVR